MFCLLLNLSSLSAFCIFSIHVYMSASVSLRLSAGLSISARCPLTSVRLSICFSVYVRVLIRLSVCLCVHVFFRLFVCPYMHLQTSLCGRCSCRYVDAIAANL